MSHMEGNLPDHMDRLALLLDHAEAMGMALTCEDFEEVNERSKKNFYSALVHVLIDARDAFGQMMEERRTEARA